MFLFFLSSEEQQKKSDAELFFDPRQGSSGWSVTLTAHFATSWAEYFNEKISHPELCVFQIYIFWHIYLKQQSGKQNRFHMHPARLFHELRFKCDINWCCLTGKHIFIHIHVFRNTSWTLVLGTCWHVTTKPR